MPDLDNPKEQSMNNQLQKFDLLAITSIDDGRIAEAVNQALQRAERDVRDRPELKAGRSVVLKVVLKPKSMQGDLSSVEVGFQISETLPKRESRTYDMVPIRGGLAFQELSLDDARQMTFDTMGPQGTVSEDEIDHKMEAANDR